ncbi:TPA: hypothetical protein ACG1QB_004380 [Enterobacter asburiae]
MDIKKVIASISGIELFFMIAGIIVPIIFIGCIFFFKITSKGAVDACRLIKHDSWAGDLISTKMESWQKTNLSHGNNLFFDVFFYTGDGSELKSAKALVALSDMHLLKKGLDIIVKQDEKGRVAVLKINF